MQTLAMEAQIPFMRISRPDDAQHHTSYLNQIIIY